MRLKNSKQVYMKKGSEISASLEGLDLLKMQIGDQVTTIPYHSWQKYKAKKSIEKIQIQMPGGDIRIELKSDQSGQIFLINSLQKAEVRASLDCGDKTK